MGESHDGDKKMRRSLNNMKTKGDSSMSDSEIVDTPVDEVVENKEEVVVERAPVKPKRKEPETNIKISTSSAIIEVPLDCGNKPETSTLINQMATAKALAGSKARVIIKAVRNAEAKAIESRPVIDMAAKKVIMEVSFEPPIEDDFVKVAQESI